MDCSHFTLGDATYWVFMGWIKISIKTKKNFNPYVGSETAYNLRLFLLNTNLNNIESKFVLNFDDGPHEIEIYFTGDHMAHYKPL